MSSKLQSHILKLKKKMVNKAEYSPSERNETLKYSHKELRHTKHTYSLIFLISNSCISIMDACKRKSNEIKVTLVQASAV